MKPVIIKNIEIGKGLPKNCRAAGGRQYAGIGAGFARIERDSF